MPLTSDVHNREYVTQKMNGRQFLYIRLDPESVRTFSRTLYHLIVVKFRLSTAYQTHPHNVNIARSPEASRLRDQHKLQHGTHSVNTVTCIYVIRYHKDINSNSVASFNVSILYGMTIIVYNTIIIVISFQLLGAKQ